MVNDYQASVVFIGDLAHIPLKDVSLVESDEDYVQICEKFRRCNETDIHLKVWVRRRHHFTWLKDFTEQIGCLTSFEEKTPRLLLADEWNVQIPDWLTDNDVLDYNLLELHVDSQEQTSFENRLLARLLGNVFQSRMLDRTHLVDVINGLVSDEAKSAFNDYPLLKHCFEAKCEQWAERSTETWVKEICRWLPENSNEVWQWLSLWAVLYGYPEKLLEYVLTPEQVLLVRKVPPDALSDLPLEPVAREQALTQVELFFEEIQAQVTSSDMFRKVLRSTSGRLLKEYQLISKILRSNRFPANEEDIKEVQEKFRSCPGISETQLMALKHYVKPDPPTLLGIDEVWSSEEWIRWTVEEYVPYRSWQVHNGYYDEDVEQTVARFADWYIDEYASIHNDPDLSLTHCLTAVSPGLSESEFSIVLLIDCLPLAFMGLLDNALRNVGLSRHDLHYRFAALPTITEYNKAALLSGKWQGNEESYEAIINVRANDEWSGKQALYLSNLKSMSEMEPPQEATVAVLNFLDGDELLHSDLESKNTTYEDELYRLFTRMAESVSKLSQEWSGSREKLNVYVVTDHGACRILEEEKRSFDSKVVNKLFSNEKHRFSAVSEDQIDEIPENMWSLGHRFKRPFISENTNYFLPRGHNTVRQAGKVKGYMHGGVTPEEVIVPAAQYKLVKVAWKSPVARFLDLDLVKETGRAKFYIQRVVTLKIEIQNPNQSDIRVFRASVLSPEADIKNFEGVSIRAKSANTLQISCYFKKAALGEGSLEIELAYEIAGEQYTLPLKLESEFKSAMPGGFSLKDL